MTTMISAGDVVSRQEYENLQAQVALLERMILNQQHQADQAQMQSQQTTQPSADKEPEPTETESDTESASENNNDEQPKEKEKKAPSLCDQARTQVEEAAKAQATTVTQMVSSVNLLEHFQLHTAFFIAGVSILTKLAFAYAFTKVETASCTPTRTIMDGDWGNETYKNIFNEKNRQFLCSSDYINQYQFRVGNARHREQYDPEFGVTDAHVDLSQYEYGWVWTAHNKGLLRSVPWGGVTVNRSEAGQEPWHRFVDVQFIDDCARRCAEVDALHGFHAFDGQSEMWECMCGFQPQTTVAEEEESTTSLCLADYFEEGSSCLGKDMHQGDNVTFYFWNDTYYVGDYLMVFSKEDSASQVPKCSASELEDLCQESNEYDTILDVAGYGERWANDTDRAAGDYWNGCSLNGFSCADYNHDQCGSYNPRCGGEVGVNGGDYELPCSGLVSVTYITCPAVSVTLGSSLGYLSYLELVIVTLLTCLFLWWRGENPYHILKANALQLANAYAQEQQKKMMANVQKQITVEAKSLAQKVHGNFTSEGKAGQPSESDQMKFLANSAIAQKGMAMTVNIPRAAVPTPRPAATPTPAPRPAPPRTHFREVPYGDVTDVAEC